MSEIIHMTWRLEIRKKVLFPFKFWEEVVTSKVTCYPLLEISKVSMLHVTVLKNKPQGVRYHVTKKNLPRYR